MARIPIVFGAVHLLLLACLLDAVDCRAQSQLPSCMIFGFSSGVQVVVGRISQAQTNAAGHTQATVSIEQYLRAVGPRFNADVVTIPVDWLRAKTQTVGMMRRKPVWYNIAPDVGKHVALVLYQEKRYVPVVPTLRCIVDLDSNPKVLGTIQQMVSVDELPPQQKVSAMQQVLSDRSSAEPLKALAIQYLTSLRDPQVCLSILQQFAPIASDVTQAHGRRMEALNFIEWAYDSFSQDSSVNDQILSFVADRIIDGDPELRSTAVQFVSPKLVGLEKQGLLNRIHFSDRQAVLQTLKQEAALGRDDSVHARKMLQALGGQ